MGLHQDELAAVLGVDKTTISNWERNLTTPALPYGPGIIQFLGYSPLEVGGSLGDQLRAYRWAHGMTQRHVARIVGVDELAVRTWEAGTMGPSPRNEGKLIDLLRDGAVQGRTEGDSLPADDPRCEASAPQEQMA